MKILFNDGIDRELKDKLLDMNIEVQDRHYEGTEFIKKLDEVEILVIRSATKLTNEIINSLKKNNLRLVIRAGAGVDNIDMKALKNKGIDLKTVPGASSSSVAELVLGHMFALARFIVPANMTMKKGEWNKRYYTGMEIDGKTLGIIGMGRIGEILGEKAKALGMNVIYFSKSGEKSNLTDFKFVELDKLYATSDFISIHVSTTDTIIGDEEIAKMKDGVFIINTSRGSVINPEALLIGINNGKVAGAGLDVFDNEPKFSQGLVNNIKISATPHIGASTIDAQRRISERIYEMINEFLGN